MKKVFSIFAVAALALGMTSCGGAPEQEEDDIKKFHFNVTDVTATTAHVTINPVSQDMTFSYVLLNNATFNYFKAQDSLKAIVKTSKSIAGFQDLQLTSSSLGPGNKYLLCAGEKDRNNNIAGDVEYVRFQTESVEAQTENITGGDDPTVPMTGVCLWDDPENKGVLGIESRYPVPSEGKTVELDLFFVADTLIGHFTTDVLFSWAERTPKMKIIDAQGHTEAELAVYATDVRSLYNEQTGKYEFRGWCEIWNEDAYRVPFVIECTEVMYEPTK